MDREKIEEKLLAKRIVVLPDNIDSKSTGKVRGSLIVLGLESATEEIKLVIDSTGGNVQSALFIYDTIQLITAPITAIVNGHCKSAAMYPLLACKKRMATANSSFLLHQMTLSISLKSDRDFMKKVKIELDAQKKIEVVVEEILVSKSKCNSKQISKLKEEGELYDRRIIAPEAKELGFIHEIVPDDYKII